MDYSTDKRIKELKPGGSVELSRENNSRVIADRSRDGETLLIYRLVNGLWPMPEETRLEKILRVKWG